MRRWKIRMTFEGYTNGATSSDAVADFKSLLGLAPAAMRSEIRMTELQTSEVEPAPDSTDAHNAWRSP